MFGLLDGQQSAQLEQYKMALQIIKTWEMVRTPVIIAGILSLLFSIFLFIRQKGGRYFFFIIALLIGIATVSMDQLKPYVDRRYKEAVRAGVQEAITSMPEKIIDLPANVGKGTTGILKKIFPFGGK